MPSSPAGGQAVVAGHSLGGMATVAHAARHGCDRVAAAALVCTGMSGLIRDSQIIKSPERFDPVKEMVGSLMVASRSPAGRGSTPASFRLTRYFALHPGASPATVAFCERLLLQCPRDVRGGVGRMLGSLDLDACVARVTCPALVIAGEHDKLTPPVHARRLEKRLPAVSAYVEVPGIGHMAPVEAPDEVSRHVRALARMPAAAAA